MNFDEIPEIVFRVTENTFGMPEPHIPDGTIVILLQNRTAEVGRYIAPSQPDDPSPAIDHPINSQELELDALIAVRKAFAQYLRSEIAHVYTCPPEIAARAIWK